MVIYLGAELAKLLFSVPNDVNATSHSYICCERPRTCIREYSPEDNLVRRSKYVKVATHVYRVA
jgi:hypothetical protein